MPSERTTQIRHATDTTRHVAKPRTPPRQAAWQITPATVIDHLPAARPAQIVALQRQVGNRAVQSVLTQHKIQPKLNVGPAGDHYEQEADRVADQVLTMPAPPLRQSQLQRAALEEDEAVQAKPLMASITPLVQRQVEDEEEVQTKPLVGALTPLVQRQAEDEEEVQTKPLVGALTPLVQRQAEDEEEVQAKPLVGALTPLVQRQAEDEEEVQTKSIDPRAGFEAGGAIEGQLRAQKGAGSPLPAEVRSFMEPRFGADFGDVRVHANGEAAQLNRQLSAQAFTHGRDIYLGEGQYAPGTDAGRRLLAHELAHTIQQTGTGRTATVQRNGTTTTLPLLAQGPHATPLSAPEKKDVEKYKTGSGLGKARIISGSLSELTEGPKGVTEGVSDSTGKWGGEFKENKVEFFDKSSQVSDVAGGVLGGVGATFGLISEMSQHLKSAIGQARDKKWGEFAQTLVLEMGSTLINQGVSAILSGGTIGTTISAMAKATGADVVKTVFGVVSPFVAFVKDMLTTGLGFFKNVLGTAAAFKEGIGKGVEATLTLIWDAGKGLLAMAGDAVSFVKQALDALTVLKGVADLASSVFACVTAVITALTAIWDGIKEIVTTVKAVIKLVGWKKFITKLTTDPGYLKSESDLTALVAGFVPKDAQGKKVGEWRLRRFEVGLEKQIQGNKKAEEKNQRDLLAKDKQILATRKEIEEKEKQKEGLAKVEQARASENSRQTSKEQDQIKKLASQQAAKKSEIKDDRQAKDQQAKDVTATALEIKAKKTALRQEKTPSKRRRLQAELDMKLIHQRDLRAKSKGFDTKLKTHEKELEEIERQLKQIAAAQSQRATDLGAATEKKAAIQKEIDTLAGRQKTLTGEKEELVKKGPALKKELDAFVEKKGKLAAIRADAQKHLMVKELANINRKRVNRAVFPILASGGRHAANLTSFLSALTTIGITIAAFAGGLSAPAAPVLAAVSQMVGALTSGAIKGGVAVGSLGGKLVRNVKQLGRNLKLPGFNTAKTTKAKQEKRARDAVVLLEMAAELPAFDAKDKSVLDQYNRVELYLQATGVNLEDLLAKNGDHVRQGKMLMDALAMREAKD